MSTTTSNAVERSSGMGFSLKDFLSSFLLIELAKGMLLTGKYAFRGKLHFNTLRKRHRYHPVFGVCMLFAATKTVKSGVSHANCVRQFALLKRFPLNLKYGMMVHGALRAMTLI